MTENTKAVTDAGNAPRVAITASQMRKQRAQRRKERDERNRGYDLRKLEERETGERIPARVRLHRAAVWDENYAREIGRVQLRAEEINHFDCCGSVAAKIALPQSEIDRLGIDAEDYVYIRRA